MIGEDDRIEIIRAHRNITSLTFLDFPLWSKGFLWFIPLLPVLWAFWVKPGKKFDGEPMSF